MITTVLLGSRGTTPIDVRSLKNHHCAGNFWRKKMKKTPLIFVGLFCVLLSACDGDPDTPQCKVSGVYCSNEGNIVYCADGNEILVQKCLSGCTNGACNAGKPCSYTGTLCEQNTLYQCVSGHESILQACPNGCSTDAKSCAIQQTGCSYTGTKCSADGKSMTTCTNGTETVNPCTCGCSNNTCNLCNVCTYSGTQCRDGSLFQCTSGLETTVQNCPNGCADDGKSCAQTTPPTPPTPSENDCIDVDGYAVDNGANGCSTEFVVSVCNNGKWGKKAQSCEGNTACWDGECVDLGDDDDVCIEGKGLRCRNNDVIDCHDDQNDYDFVETCIEGCTNGVCDAVACPTTPIPSCFDNKTILACDSASNTMKKTPCPNNQSCVNGECVDSSQQTSCDFEAMCTADRASIKKCTAGKINYETCPIKTYCNDEGSTPQCKSAMISEDQSICDETNFISACDGRTAYTCNAGYLDIKTCDKNSTCINGICHGQSNKKIGDTCTVGSFDDTCIDNTPVTCDKKTKRITIIDNEENCSNSGSICGFITDNGIATYSCFEPCKEKGSSLNSCIGNSPAYQTTLECVDIGNGKLGYDHISASYTTCDIGCEKGKCVDYTTDVDDVGQPCESGKYAGKCVTASKAVACDLDNNDDYTVQVEICDYDEVCMTYKKYNTDTENTAECMKQCKSGDPDIYICEMGNFAVSKKYHCTTQDGHYGYVPTGEMDYGNECGDDGKIKK